MAKNDLKAKRRICFRLRYMQDNPEIEFGMIINHIHEKYKVRNGGVYELPEYVIDYIHSFKVEETYRNSDGTEEVVLVQKYFCEPVSDGLGSK